MNTSTISQAREQARAGFSEITEKVKDVSGSVKERWNDAYREAERGARKVKIAAEEGLDEARKQIKARPIAAVAVVATGAFILGGIVGLLVAKSDRR